MQIPGRSVRRGSKRLSSKETKNIFYTKTRSGLIKDGSLGCLHLYYGQGVGKTTRTVGLAIRAAGKNLQVAFIQFMKSDVSGEVAILKQIPNIRYRCPGKHPFIMSDGPRTVHYEHANKAFDYALEAVAVGSQLIVCDEMLDTVIFEIFEQAKLLELIAKCKTDNIELVLTGRIASPELVREADYVTEFVQIKHPYYNGAKSREGIEY